MKFHKTLLLALATMAVLVMPGVASAQVKSADVAPFMGTWAIGLETPQGAMTMNLTVKDDNGTVVGSLTSDLGPDPQKITDITKTGESLVLKYTLDAQGMSIPAKIVMTPAGDKMSADLDFADGQFVVPGTVTKK